MGKVHLQLCEADRLHLQGLVRQQSIPSIEGLAREGLALVAERHAKAIKITRQFSMGQARDKFARHYQRVHAGEQLLYYGI